MKKQNKTKEQYINIPYSIMMREDLSQTEKIIYGFINGFKGNNVCYASNAYISNVLVLSERQVSRSISKLITLTLVSSMNGKGRSRSLFTNNIDTSDTNPDTGDINTDTSVQQTLTPVSSNNIVDNINNNINNSISLLKEDKYLNGYRDF